LNHPFTVNFTASAYYFLAKSRETLRYVSLIRLHNHSRLLSIHFPSLHTLKIVPWDIYRPSELQNMSQFILSHSKTLQVLDFTPYNLPYEHENNPDFFPFIQSRNQPLGPEYKTHLKSFGGNFSFFLLLLDSGLQSVFAQLENLVLFNQFNFARPLRQDYDLRICTFSSLRRLRFEICGWSFQHEDDWAINWLTWLRLLIRKCQAKLEVLILKLPFAVDAETLVESLSQNNSLETIYLSWSVTSGHKEEEYVKILSSHCKSLRKVQLSKTVYTLSSCIDNDFTETISSV
jgi:hypothetical protein